MKMSSRKLEKLWFSGIVPGKGESLRPHNWRNKRDFRLPRRERNNPARKKKQSSGWKKNGKTGWKDGEKSFFRRKEEQSGETVPGSYQRTSMAPLLSPAPTAASSRSCPGFSKSRARISANAMPIVAAQVLP